MPGLAAQAAAAKRQLSALASNTDGSPDMGRLKRVTMRGEAESGKGEDGRSRGGSFERDSSDFSPSRVFAPISENVIDVGDTKRKLGIASPIGKLRGPERVLVRSDSNKENVLSFDIDEADESIFISSSPNFHTATFTLSHHVHTFTLHHLHTSPPAPPARHLHHLHTTFTTTPPTTFTPPSHHLHTTFTSPSHNTTLTPPSHTSISHASISHTPFL
jgi:hypothetical protein